MISPKVASVTGWSWGRIVNSEAKGMAGLDEGFGTDDYKVCHS